MKGKTTPAVAEITKAPRLPSRCLPGSGYLVLRRCPRGFPRTSPSCAWAGTLLRAAHRRSPIPCETSSTALPSATRPGDRTPKHKLYLHVMETMEWVLICAVFSQTSPFRREPHVWRNNVQSWSTRRIKTVVRLSRNDLCDSTLGGWDFSAPE